MNKEKWTHIFRIFNDALTEKAFEFMVITVNWDKQMQEINTPQREYEIESFVYNTINQCKEKKKN